MGKPTKTPIRINKMADAWTRVKIGGYQAEGPASVVLKTSKASK